MNIIRTTALTPLTWQAVDGLNDIHTQHLAAGAANVMSFRRLNDIHTQNTAAGAANVMSCRRLNDIHTQHTAAGTANVMSFRRNVAAILLYVLS